MNLFDRTFLPYYEDVNIDLFNSSLLFHFEHAYAAVLLQFLLSPIALLLFTTVISLSYRICISFNTSPVLKQFLINFHAIATECCQLLLLVLGIVDTTAVIETVVDMVGWQSISPVEAAFLVEVVVGGSLAYHWVAMVAVDVVESWITLGHLTHPYNGRPFVLTRNALLSLWRWLKPTISPQRQPPPTPTVRHRSSSTDESIDVLDAIISRKAKLYQGLAKDVEYLDLAGLESLRGASWQQFADIVKLMGAHATFESYAAKYRSGGSVKDEDLPTPPDSDQAKETKRVEWAPTMAVLSPSGTERWLSLP